MKLLIKVSMQHLYKLYKPSLFWDGLHGLSNLNNMFGVSFGGPTTLVAEYANTSI